MVKEIRGILKDDSGRRIVTAAFCCNGHNLVDSANPKIDGVSTIHLLAHSLSAGDVDIYLSPIQGDSRVVGGEGILKDELLDLKCPVCGVSFEVVAPCYCRHGMFVAIYLKQDCRYQEAIVVCNSWGCKHSFVKLESRIILSSK